MRWQVRFFQDCLRTLCFSLDSPWLAGIKLSSFRRLIAHLTEDLWAIQIREVLSTLKERCNRRQAGGLVVLDDSLEVPEEVSKVLNNGPKFSYEHRIPAHDLLALNRRIARKAPQEDKERCVLEGVDVIARCVTSGPPSHKPDPTRKVVAFFKDNNLQLMQADKEGGFVVVPSGTFSEKASQALKKNFVPVKASATRKKGICHVQRAAAHKVSEVC